MGSVTPFTHLKPIHGKIKCVNYVNHFWYFITENDLFITIFEKYNSSPMNRLIKPRIIVKKKGKTVTDAPRKKLIKVQLDHRTVVTLKDMSAFKFWLEKYPNAKIITP